jgi:hypothetical protein
MFRNGNLGCDWTFGKRIVRGITTFRPAASPNRLMAFAIHGGEIATVRGNEATSTAVPLSRWTVPRAGSARRNLFRGQCFSRPIASAPRAGWERWHRLCDLRHSTNFNRFTGQSAPLGT